MFVFIKGLLQYSSPSYCVVDVQGVGYKTFIAPNTYSKLPQVGEKCFIHTSFIVRENSQALYGFNTPEERNLFETLLNINGVGPKLALSLIGHMSLEDLSKAVSSDDVKQISKVPGIGKKTAERLIIEMRGKFERSAQTPRCSKTNDLLSALINLGYSQSAAEKAVQKTLESNPKEENFSLLIRQALTTV